MPIRFTSPSLGGYRLGFIQSNEWEVGISYRRLTADDWFVGSDIEPGQAPGGKPNIFNIHTIDLSASYGISDLLSLRLTVPISTGTNSRIHPDGVRRETSATGIGDISLVGTLWLLDPVSHADGNVAVGLGMKLPTGSNDVMGELGLPGGTVQHPVHPGLQLGDGGWGIILEIQAYQRLVAGLSAYAFLSYLVSPRETSDVTFSPTSDVLSVPDVYHGRVGLAYSILPDGVLSASLGARVDGIPVRDLVGGDEGIRSPGYTLFLDPGLAVIWERNTFTVSVPIRMHGEFKKNVGDLRGDPPTGGRGDLASYLIYLGVTRRL